MTIEVVTRLHQGKAGALVGRNLFKKLEGLLLLCSVLCMHVSEYVRSQQFFFLNLTLLYFFFGCVIGLSSSTTWTFGRELVVLDIFDIFM